MSGHEKGRALVLTAIMVISVAAAGMAFTGTVAAEELTVSGGSGLDTAIDNADSGDTITVTDSDDYDPITVETSDILIQAADDETPSISATSDDDTPVIVNGNGDDDATNITIEGFTISDGGNDITVLSSVQGTTGVTSDITLTGNTFEGTGTQSVSVSTNADSVTIEGNEFNVDDSDVDVFVGSPSTTTINGEDNANDQIVAVDQSNSGAVDYNIGDTQYGIEVDPDNVTTAGGLGDEQADVTATLYGAQGDGDVRYDLDRPNGDDAFVLDTVDTNDDGPTTFSFSAPFAFEGSYTLNVNDVDGDSVSGSTEIHSEYDVINLQPDSLTSGDDDTEITGNLVDRSGEGVNDETVALQNDDDDDDDEDSTETNESGYFVLNDGDSGDDLNFEQGDTVAVTGDSSASPDDNDAIVYETYDVTQEVTWTVDANRSSVPFEIPTTVSINVSEDGDPVTGSELEGTDLTVEQDGESVLIDDDDGDSQDYEYTDTDGDDIDGESNSIRFDVEAMDQSEPVVINVSDEDDFGTTSLTVGEEEEPVGEIDAEDDHRIGDVTVGESATEQITVENTGDGPVSVDETSITGSDAFTVVGGGAPFTLASGETHEIDVQFAPESAGDMSAVLTTETENDGAATTRLTGTGIAEERATVNFEDQTSDGETVTVDSVFVPEDGYVAIHNDSLLDGNVQGSVIGVSEYLEAGTYNNLEVDLFDVPGADYEDDDLEESQTLIAMPHQETSGNQQYNFLTSDGSEDGAYTDDDGAVTDSGFVTVEQPVGQISAEDDHRIGNVTVGESATEKVTVENTGDGPVTVDQTSISGSNAFSVVGGGADFTLAPGETHNVRVQYAPESTGDMTATLTTDTENDGAATTELSGTGIMAGHTLRVEGSGDYAFYSFRTTENIELTSNPNQEDRVRQNTASGAVGGGTDTYTFMGDLQNLYVQEGATVFVDGEQVDSDNYESVVSFRGSGNTSTYNFETKNGQITGTNGLSGEDSVSESSASGAVAGGSDTYRLTGTFQGLDEDGDAMVVLNGQSVDPSLFYNTLRFEGQGTTASYDFATSGEVKDTMGLSGEDSVDDNGASGAIRGGSDTYVYSGTLDDLNTDGDVVVTRNGETITEGDN